MSKPRRKHPWRRGNKDGLFKREHDALEDEKKSAPERDSHENDQTAPERESQAQKSAPEQVVQTEETAPEHFGPNFRERNFLSIGEER